MTQPVSEPVQRVWMDVTMLARCATQPTGISRVVLAILENWRKGAFDDLRLCRFDDAAGGFVEVAVSILDRFQPQPNANESPGPHRPSRRNRLRHVGKQVVKPLVSWLPVSVKRLLKRKVRGFVHVAKEIAKIPVQQLKRLLKKPAPIQTLELGPTDLVVMLGDDWSAPERSRVIYRLKRDRGFRTAWLIYDLIPILFPQFFGPGFPERFTPWLVDTLWASDLVLTISENTRVDIQQYCLRGGIPCPPVEVVRLGENLPDAGEASVPHALRMTDTESFALCVGTVEVRKNQLLLYHVWRKLIEIRGSTGTPRLIVVGMRGWMGSNTMHLAEVDPVTREHIRFLPKCNDAELRWLYQHCAFTLYPSFYEGWGLPVAESLAFGKHCIAGNRSSIPEIAGDLVAMHDPSSVDECLKQVMEALDPAFRARCEERIRREYRRREWSECAEQMAEFVRNKFEIPVSRDAKELRSGARLAG